MNPSLRYTLALTLILALVALPAQAVVTLSDYGFNIDGTKSLRTFGDPIPSEVDTSNFDDMSGLGSIKVTIGGAGSHSFLFYIDLDIVEAMDGFDNEYGHTTGVVGANDSWEIDDPVSDDILFDNFLNGMYDVANGVPLGSESDVAMGLGWAFDLAIDEIAVIGLDIGQALPTSTFYLTQTDPDGTIDVHFSGALTIGVQRTPIPATLFLMGAGLLATRTRSRS